MLSLEREVLAAPIDAQAKERIAAIERRAIVPVRTELRALLWAGVALVSGGAGVLVAQNLERIGHLTLIVAIFAATVTCYGFAWRMRGGRARGAEEGAAPAPHVAGEYLLLLGALLLSTDVAYAEAQWRIFGPGWRWHLLILAVVHGAAAYLFASRKVLSLAIVALAGLFGVDREGELFARAAGDTAARFAAAAAAVALWRVVHQRASRLRSFDFALEQAAFHLAMIASITAIQDERLGFIGPTAALALAALGAWHGVRAREESFVVFAILYAVVAIDLTVVPEIDDLQWTMVWLVVTTPAAIVALYVLHRRWKERFA